MQVAIIKYNAGNVQSVQYGLQRIGVESKVTDDAAEIRLADKVIFPGVGHAGSAMAFIREKQLDVVIKSLSQPVLGICLGMQLMCDHSEEGNTDCLGIFNSQIHLFDSDADKVPHTGWNSLHELISPLFTGLPDGEFVYAVHSYYADISADTVAQTKYILPFSAALQKDNFYGVQFHPEKSGLAGERILKNFIELL